jgi:Zn-dependent peptidase ImmA (M78 family)
MANLSQSQEWQLLTENEQNAILKHQQVLPIQIGSIAKELGLVVKSSTLQAGISGEIREENDKFVIRVNRHDSKSRQRFTIAHEIGHYLLHRDRIGDGIVDDILYRSSLSNALEAQANRIAADILMPIKLINESLNSLSSKKGEALYESVAQIADVSPTALKIRLGKL